jgi:radical SAM superfamily enzyme YgiQ (UPF0313 family)
MLNGLTTTSGENESFVDRFRELTRGMIPVITGGEHASMFPESARRYSDFIFAHEGDEGVLTLLEALEEGDPLTRDSLLSCPDCTTGGRTGCGNSTPGPRGSRKSTTGTT